MNSRALVAAAIADDDQADDDDHEDDHGNKPAPAVDQVFATLDTNLNRSLSLSEFKKFSQGPGKGNIDRLFAAWDTDASSSLSLTEFTAGFATLQAMEILKHHDA